MLWAEPSRLSQRHIATVHANQRQNATVDIHDATEVAGAFVPATVCVERGTTVGAIVA